MLGNGGAARAAVTGWYVSKMSRAHWLLGELVRLTRQDEWKKIAPTYHAAQWHLMDCPHGPFTGRAIVWKLQVEVHRDVQDAKGAWCVCFNGGLYQSADPNGRTGIAFPDLDLIFE